MAAETATLIDYYDAFETLLRNVRALGEYRTHFGFLENPSQNYCFFKAICNTDESVRREAQLAMDRLHTELFGALQPVPSRVLDVGFGCAGTLRRLASEWPNAELHGLNLNAGQKAIALSAIGNRQNVVLHLADFLEYRAEKPFDLIYFIESAFHIRDKPALAARLSELLAPQGQAFIVDIFYSQRLARRQAEPTEEELFDYRSVDDWRRLLGDAEIDVVDFEDWSLEASHHTRVATSEAEFLNDLVVPNLPPNERAPTLERHLLHAYNGYRRLSRLLARRLLRYGILRCVKR